MTPFAGRSGARDAALRVLALIAALIGAPRHDAAAQEKVLRAAMHADLRILDRHWITAVISVTHGTLVYDTLFALDDARNSHPGIAIQRRFLGGPSRGQERWDVTRRKNPWPKNDAGSLSGPAASRRRRISGRRPKHAGPRTIRRIAMSARRRP